MRKLTDIEVQQVDDRLQNLRIQYMEIYDEIKDHYLSELEKKSAEEFETTFQELNEAFARSVVKKMEKNLELSTNRLIAQLQWNELKFWKLNNQRPLYPLLMILVLGLVYSYADVAGMPGMVVFVSLVGIPLTWYAIGKEISFSPKQFSLKSMRAFPRQILRRSSIFVGGLTWIYVVVINWNNTSSPGPIGTIVIWLIIAPFLLYMLTLVQVALTWKGRQPRAVSQ